MYRDTNTTTPNERLLLRQGIDGVNGANGDCETFDYTVYHSPSRMVAC